jgi:type IV secretion system protein VirB10
MTDLPHAQAPSAPDTPLNRTISPIACRFGAGRAGKALTLAGLAAGCAVLLTATWHHGKAAPRKAPPEPARQVVAFEAAAADPAPTLAHPGADPPQLSRSPAGASDVEVPAIQPGAAGAAAQSRGVALAQRAAQQAAMLGAPIMVFGGSSGANAGDAASAQSRPPGPAMTDASTELDRLRRGSPIGLARARRLPDRNFLLLAGASLPCELLTAMDTATPGYVSCLVPQDVYSENGAVVLLEKGSKVLGEYRSGMRQGQSRLFVLWTRAVTPGGVAIDLASPATDALRRAGFDGAVETFFWQRFGGALLLSIVGDAATGAAARGAHGTVEALPSDAAGIALQNSVNIPPMLRKPQGSEVAIFVAQDLDFSSVYGLAERRK